jgi:hypothetical protein
LLECVAAWDGNWTHDCFIAFGWESPDGRPLLVVVNYADHQSQCFVRLPFGDLGGTTWQFEDLIGEATYEQDGDTLKSQGLFLDLGAWIAHVFDMSPSHRKA